MPRTPSRQQNTQFGTQNQAGSARALVPPLIRQQGPAQAVEQFGTDVPPAVARALNQLQANIKAAMGQAKGSPFSNGNLLENVALTGGVTSVLAHGLGAPWRGYIVGKIFSLSTGTALQFVPNNPSSLDSKQIQLQANNSCNVDLWVYA